MAYLTDYLQAPKLDPIEVSQSLDDLAAHSARVVEAVLGATRETKCGPILDFDIALVDPQDFRFVDQLFKEEVIGHGVASLGQDRAGNCRLGWGQMVRKWDNHGDKGWVLKEYSLEELLDLRREGMIPEGTVPCKTPELFRESVFGSEELGTLGSAAVAATVGMEKAVVGFGSVQLIESSNSLLNYLSGESLPSDFPGSAQSRSTLRASISGFLRNNGFSPTTPIGIIPELVLHQPFPPLESFYFPERHAVLSAIFAGVMGQLDKMMDSFSLKNVPIFLYTEAGSVAQKNLLRKRPWFEPVLNSIGRSASLGFKNSANFNGYDKSFVVLGTDYKALSKGVQANADLVRLRRLVSGFPISRLFRRLRPSSSSLSTSTQH